MIVDNLPEWQPLRRITPLRLSTNVLGSQRRMVVGAFGSCGNPLAPGYTSYRHAVLIPRLQEYDVADHIYNPEVPEWKPENAVTESIHLARDHIVVVVVTNDTSGHASIMEAGMATLSGILRGQHVIVWFDDLTTAPQSTQIARMLAQDVLQTAFNQFPLFTIARNLDDLATRAAILMHDAIRHQNAGIQMMTEYELPVRSTPLRPVIYLSGTSGTQKPGWMHKIYRHIGDRAPVEDSYHPGNWLDYIQTEQRNKITGGVQLLAITEETESLGALAELGPRAAYAYLSGQAFGVYINPRHTGSTIDSPSNRTRTLALAHLRRIQADFPMLPIFVARSLEQLAWFGLHEYEKFQQQMGGTQ